MIDAYVTVWLFEMSACTRNALSLASLVILMSLKIQIVPSMSQSIRSESDDVMDHHSIRSESDDVMSGCVLYLVLGIATPPPPVIMLLLVNLPGYRGPTIVKPVLSWARPIGLSPGWLQTGTILSGGGAPLLPSLYKNPEPPVTSGEAGWTVGSMHLHHT